MESEHDRIINRRLLIVHAMGTEIKKRSDNKKYSEPLIKGVDYYLRSHPKPRVRINANIVRNNEVTLPAQQSLFLEAKKETLLPEKSLQSVA